MNAASSIAAVVVIPARNEADRIAGCLDALAMQDTRDVGVIVLANNCDDATGEIASTCAAKLGLSFELVTCTLVDGVGVGTARRMGCDAALSFWPNAHHLLFTDADCHVAPDWIARNRNHLASVSAVCGRVAPMTDELNLLNGIDVRPAELEGRYDALVNAFYRLHRSGPCGLIGDHGHAAGASLSVRAEAYRSVGGFAEVPTGEDRDLVRRLKHAGHAVLHAGDVSVTASCRLDGRAPDGMSDALRARVARTHYLIDDGLPPARQLIDAARDGSLGPWPLLVAPEERLRAHDLAPQIALLEAALLAACHPARDPAPMARSQPAGV